jgi:hypothetical protein
MGRPSPACRHEAAYSNTSRAPNRRSSNGRWRLGGCGSIEATVDAQAERELLVAARRGEQAAFERLVFAYRGELLAHCYRMLGSVQDAEDALQESLLGAWRGLRAFEGRSSVRTWLYQIATNASLRLISRRPRRILSPDYGPPRRSARSSRRCSCSRRGSAPFSSSATYLASAPRRWPGCSTRASSP